MVRLKANNTILQELDRCNGKLYMVVVPSKIVSRNKLKKGDVFVWEDNGNGFYIKKIILKK